jgi:cellobiose-specific phosphotransferase system component IIA
MKTIFKGVLSAVLIVSAGVASAQTPVQNIEPQRHGNLAAAQELVTGAFDRLSEAQFANHDALGGHAVRAKELLRQANEEIKLAAIAANDR